jgi:hypothetical protein
MKNVDGWFILIGLLYGAFGFAFGIWVGINERFDQAHLHAHINLVGWASMVLFGLLYRASLRSPRTSWPPCISLSTTSVPWCFLWASRRHRRIRP